MNHSSSKYAKALYNSCKDSASLPAIQKELYYVEYLFKKVPVFRLVLMTKRINNDDKQKIIKATLSQFNPIIIEFISSIIKENLSSELLNIISKFNRLVNMHEDIKKIDIITAEKIEKSYLDNIAENISSILNSSPTINYVVEPKIIGGMKLKIGNKIFDNSVSYQLNQLKKTLYNR